MFTINSQLLPSGKIYPLNQYALNNQPIQVQKSLSDEFVHFTGSPEPARRSLTPDFRLLKRTPSSSIERDLQSPDISTQNWAKKRQGTADYGLRKAKKEEHRRNRELPKQEEWESLVDYDPGSTMTEQPKKRGRPKGSKTKRKPKTQTMPVPRNSDVTASSNNTDKTMLAPKPVINQRQISTMSYIPPSTTSTATNPTQAGYNATNPFLPATPANQSSFYHQSNMWQPSDLSSSYPVNSSTQQTFQTYTPQAPTTGRAPIYGGKDGYGNDIWY